MKIACLVALLASRAQGRSLCAAERAARVESFPKNLAAVAARPSLTDSTGNLTSRAFAAVLLDRPPAAEAESLLRMAFALHYGAPLTDRFEEAAMRHHKAPVRYSTVDQRIGSRRSNVAPVPVLSGDDLRLRAFLGKN